MNEYANTNVPSDNTQAYSTPSHFFCTAPHSLLENYFNTSRQPNTPYMLPTISYYNGVSDVHRHKSMEEQLDRMSNKDSPSSNASMDLVLEKQRELIVGLVIEDVFVLPSKCWANSTSYHLFLSKSVLTGLQIGKFEIIKKTDIKMTEHNLKISVKEHKNKCVAEWVDIKCAPFICSALMPSPQNNRLRKKRYTFDMNKCDQMFDILLQEDHIRSLDHHDMPSLSDIGKSDYCKWHGVLTHNTNECNVFHRQIQSAIDEGRLTFENCFRTGGA
jgi:hypothetical protein